MSLFSHDFPDLLVQTKKNFSSNKCHMSMTPSISTYDQRVRKVTKVGETTSTKDAFDDGKHGKAMPMAWWWVMGELLGIGMEHTCIRRVCMGRGGYGCMGLEVWGGLGYQSICMGATSWGTRGQATLAMIYSVTNSNYLALC
jgi:hypothetical protein